MTASEGRSGGQHDGEEQRGRPEPRSASHENPFPNGIRSGTLDGKEGPSCLYSATETRNPVENCGKRDRRGGPRRGTVPVGRSFSGGEGIGSVRLTGVAVPAPRGRQELARWCKPREIDAPASPEPRQGRQEISQHPSCRPWQGLMKFGRTRIPVLTPPG
jgi:hypothetical protein